MTRRGYCAVRPICARLAFAATGAVCQCRRMEPQTDGGAPTFFRSLRNITLRVAGTRIERWNLLMPKFGGRTRAISVGGAVLAGLAGVVGVVIFANPAGAWSITKLDVAGHACASSTGTFNVTYTGVTGNGDNGTVTATATPSGTSVTPETQEVTGGTPFTITQSGIPGTASSASLTIKVDWHGDNNPATKTVIAMKDTSSPDLTIKVTGYQWKWGYDYLQEGISFYSSLATPRDQLEGKAPKGEHYLLEVDNPIRKLAESVAMLHIGPEGVTCTSSLVGTDLLATNYHCIEHSLKFLLNEHKLSVKCDDVIAEFDYLQSNLPGSLATCTEVIRADPVSDVAILRIAAPPKQAGGVREGLVRVSASPDPTEMWILHHPVGRPMVYETHCSQRGKSDVDVLHDCQTDAGSSGAPLFGTDNKLVGMHYFGPYPPTWTIEQVQIDVKDNGPKYNRAKQAQLLDQQH